MGSVKLKYLIGSLIICLVAILAVVVGLVAGGVVDLFTTSVTFRTEGATYEYDGTEKTLDQWTISKGGLKKGHTAQVTVTGKQKEVGASGNTISVAIFDKDGNDVTTNYNISFDVGELKVTKRVLSIESVSADKEYDGQKLTANDYVVTEGSLAPKQKIVAKITGTIDDIGECENTIEAKIMANDEDVTDNYDLKVKAGKLAIGKRKLVVKTADAQKVYDGKPLFSDSYEIVEGSLLDGHKLKVASKTSITSVGIVDNVADVSVYTGSVDLANKYDLVVGYGKLKVAIAEITVKTGSKTKIFDGKPLVCEEFAISKGNLKDGHTLSLTFAINAVQAGEYENEAEFLIVDKSGKDITEQYIINSDFGTLTISPLEVTVSSENETKEYDATPLTGKADTCKIVGGGLLEGHTITFRMLGSQLNVGTSDNSFAALIYDENGTNVTSSYTVNYLFGTLEVTKTPLLVKTGSASKTYDGTPLTCKDAQAEAIKGRGGLKGEDYIDIDSIEFANSQTDVGSIDNVAVGIVIRNAKGDDITGNYDISTVWGKLSVIKAKIQVRAGSKTKADDGEPLTCDKFTVDPEGGIAEGETITVTIEGSQDGVGTSDNVITSVSIKDAFGNDKTYNYDITTKDGTLRITGERPQSPSLDASGSTGGSLATGEGEDEGKEYTSLKIKSDISGKVYLRFMSYGDFVSNVWQQATEYGLSLNGDYGYAYLVGSLLKESGVSVAKLEIENYTQDYLLPYYLAMEESGYEVQLKESVFSGDTSQTYSVLHYVFDYVSDKAKLSARSTYTSEEKSYCEFALAAYQNVPDTTRAYLERIIADNGFDANDSEVISKVAKYIQSAAAYNLKYDKALDKEQDVAVSFLRDYKEGVCRHYATAATLLFRALGFPARYTIGYSCDAEAGKWVEVSSMLAHAWVEVYVKGVGWVCVEVTGGAGGSGSGSGSGTGSGTGSGSGAGGGSNSMSVAPIDLIKEYGVEAIDLDASEITKVKGFDKFASDYTYQVVCSGKLSAPGIGKSKIEKFTVFDKDGNDVTSNFDIRYNEGRLQLYLFEATVTTGSASKFYDGEDLTCGECSIEGLEMGHTAQYAASGVQRKVGLNVNKADVKIFDASGDDVTQVYKITKAYGVLEVKARQLTVTSGSAKKKYDGKALVCNEYELSEADDENGIGLANGHTIEVNIVGSQTNPGKCANMIESVTISDKDGNDVTSNYSVTYVLGQLRVTRK